MRKFSNICSSREYDLPGRLIKTSMNQNVSSPQSNLYIVPCRISSEEKLTVRYIEKPK